MNIFNTIEFNVYFIFDIIISITVRVSNFKLYDNMWNFSYRLCFGTMMLRIVYYVFEM